LIHHIFYFFLKKYIDEHNFEKSFLPQST